MKIRDESPTFYILKAIRNFIIEAKDTLRDYGPSFSALMSRKSLDEVLTAMPGYKSNQTGSRRNYYASLSRLKKKGFINFLIKTALCLLIAAEALC